MLTHHDRPEAVQTIYTRGSSWEGIILVLTLFFAVAALAQDAGAQMAKGAEAKSIKLGLISEINKSAIEEHFREFTRYVARRMSPGTEDQAKVVIAPTIFEMAKLLEQRRVDFYMESPYPTYRINYVHGAGKTILRRWKGGRAEYQSLIITKRDGGIKQLSDLRGKTIIFEDPGSTSGYLLPKLFLSRNGFKLMEKRGFDPYASPNEITYFFAYSRSKLMESVLTLQAAAGTISDDDYASLDDKGKAAITVLSQTEMLPHHLVSVRSDLAPLVAGKLEEVLLSMHVDEEGRRVLNKIDQTTKFDRLPGGEEALRKRLLGSFSTPDRKQK
jgi:phosphate/phosphite/phosphonate ABC transporter binding protein